VSRTSVSVRNWFAEMERAFERAHYRRASEIYDDAILSGDRPSNEAILLRGRLFLKIDSKRIVPFLLKHELKKATPAQAARRSMYLGTGYARMGELGEADRHFAEAKRTFRQGPALAELAIHITRRYADKQDFAAAETWRQKALLDRSLRGRIRSEHLAAHIFARNQQYHEQAESVLRVLDLIGDKRDEFAEEWYIAVHTLAVLARELPIPHAAQRARAEVDQEVEWPLDFATNHFQALKGVAWCQALAGDELSCLRYLRLAQKLDIKPIWKVILYLDRSFFASVVGEHQWSLNEFSAAEDLAESISWDETAGEERVALLLLAEAASRHAPKRAPFYIARFNDLGKLRNQLQHFAFDDRLKAMAAYASGVVKLASNDAKEAEEQLRIAWGVFDRIGYDVRAGASALALYRATGKKRWSHLAEDKLEPYPRSWLTKTAEAAAQPKVDLSKMQRVVTELTCEGLSTDEIAKRLDLSRNTILNHLKVVYKKVGVNTRQGLVVEAMKRKLIT
jgi:DNA-binding CsgD family transcriptional regulator